jgi:hypothetical protein
VAPPFSHHSIIPAVPTTSSARWLIPPVSKQSFLVSTSFRYRRILIEKKHPNVSKTNQRHQRAGRFPAPKQRNTPGFPCPALSFYRPSCSTPSPCSSLIASPPSAHASPLPVGIQVVRHLAIDAQGRIIPGRMRVMPGRQRAIRSPLGSGAVEGAVSDAS